MSTLSKLAEAGRAVIIARAAYYAVRDDHAAYIVEAAYIAWQKAATNYLRIQCDLP